MPNTNNLEESTQLEEFINQDDMAQIKSQLITCPEINTSLVGSITELSKNHAKSVLITTAEMIVDDQGLIHNAFVFAAAEYVAQASINKEFSILIGSKSFFYAPLKLGDILELEAQSLFDESSKKREVKVVGKVKDIKVFEANMQIVSSEEHVFKIKRPSTASKASLNANQNSTASASQNANATS